MRSGLCGRANMVAVDCLSEAALKVRPVKGQVVVFYSLTPDGALDESSLHGSCPVLAATEEKWAANKWIW